MKILIAPDSYKGCLSALEVAKAIERGIMHLNQSIETIISPMADGGEGTVQSLIDASKGKIIRCEVQNALNKKISAFYGIMGDEKTAVIEVAAASGLILIDKKNRNPLIANTYGTGELIKNALDKGCQNFIIGLGGSATNDAGTGMAKALGVKFLDTDDKEIALGGSALIHLAKIDLSHLDPRIKTATFTAACDVENPLCGINGASMVYAAQKGASNKDCIILDEALAHFALIAKQQLQKDIEAIPGAGAAGGLGAGLMLFLNAKLQSGIELVMEVSGLKYHLNGIDLIITGEGKMDTQTAFGKTPFGIAQMAQQKNIPVIAINGSLGKNHESLYQQGFNEIYALSDENINIEEAIANAEELIENKTKTILGNWLSKKR